MEMDDFFTVMDYNGAQSLQMNLMSDADDIWTYRVVVFDPEEHRGDYGISAPARAADEYYIVMVTDEYGTDLGAI